MNTLQKVGHYLHRGGSIFQALASYKYTGAPHEFISQNNMFSVLEHERTDEFNIRLLQWNRDAHIALHDHDMYETVGMKVLLGVLKEDILVNEDAIQRQLPIGSISIFPGKHVYHAICVKENPCLTIHIEKKYHKI